MKRYVMVLILAILAGALAHVARVSSIARNLFYRRQIAAVIAAGSCCPAPSGERYPYEPRGREFESLRARQNSMSYAIPQLRNGS